MQLIWLDPENLDRRDVAGAVALLEAARALDSPHEPVVTVAAFLAGLRHGWDGDPNLGAIVRDDRSRVVGLIDLLLPRWDNTHLGYLDVTVDPCVRRHGLGTALFEAGVERIRAEGRGVVMTGCFDETPGVGFAKAMGLDRASDDVQRRQDLTAIDLVGIADISAAATRHSSAYELVRLPDVVPDDLVADLVYVTGAINDAPTDDLDIEDEVFSAERLRGFEAGQVARARRIYRLVARARATGALVGQTLVSVDAEHPHYAWQYDTSVLSAHRGHRLGLGLKAGMLRWLAEAEPQLRTLDTWNAASNAHMIEVNEELGYRVVARAVGWQRHL